MPIEIAPLTPAIGAEVRGIDLGRPLTARDTDALYAALVEHLVVFLRDQAVTPDAHMALAESFGTVDAPHPVYAHVEGFPSMVCLDTSASNPPDTDCWHSDLSFKQDPPFASILRAVTIPATGGDTLWASAVAAYDGLPPTLKQEIEGLEAVHEMGSFRNNFVMGPGGSAARLTEAMGRFGCAVKPVVGISPTTGRRYLDVNEGFTQHVCGLGRGDSDALLARLFRAIARPEVQVRFRWSAGAVAIWDNRVTQHYAAADYLPQRRVMHRVTVVEDRRTRGVRAA